MRRLFLLGLTFIAFAIGTVVLNAITGIELSSPLPDEIESSFADRHLVQSFCLIFFSLVGNILLLFSSQKLLEEQQKLVLLNENSEIDIKAVSQKRQKAFPYSIATILMVLVSLFTGTISQAGQFPLLHGVLGFALGGALVAGFVYWYLFLLFNRRR